MLVTSSLSMTSNLRLGPLGFPSFLDSLCRRSRRRSSLGSRSLLLLSCTEVSELRLGRRSRSRDLSESAKMLGSLGGALGCPARRFRSSSVCGGMPRALEAKFSVLVLTPFAGAGGGGGARLFGGSATLRLSCKDCQTV